MKTVNGIVIQRSRGEVAFMVFKITLLVLLSVFFMLPYFFMLFRSVMTVSEVQEIPIAFFPKTLDFSNYVKIFEADYATYTLNTLLVVVIGVVVEPLSASLAAYAFGKMKFVGKRLLFGVMLATIMIPPAIVQVPLYVMYVQLNFIDTLAPMIVPGFFGGGALYIFLITQFIKGIPNSLEDAAKIDGAGVIRRYAMVTLPLCVPILLYVAFTVFNAKWGDFYTPMVYLQSPEKYTLAMGFYMQTILGGQAMKYANTRMAAGVFLTIIPLILMFFFQKQLVEGVVVSGIKV